jgi:hypothetical protein
MVAVDTNILVYAHRADSTGMLPPIESSRN